MGWHVVGAFGSVAVKRCVFWYHLVKMAFEVFAYGWVGVFGNGEAGGSVLDKNMRQANLYILKFRELGF